MNTSLEYIIIQAGGKGTRMGHLCSNKPKALISIHGQPLLIRMMRQYPHAKFIIIADYKKEALKQYLRVYASGRYEVVEADMQGTCAGISQAIARVPSGKPLAIFWCDLFFEYDIIPSCLSISENNYIGISKTFPCRWKFENGQLQEEQSNTQGVAGVYLFKNKDVIENIPSSGEFCRFLKSEVIAFIPFELSGVHEVGTVDAYARMVKKEPIARPFNEILMKENMVIKFPRDAQGQFLAAYEQAWYDWVKTKNWWFLPRVISTNPLKLKRINGDTITNTPVDEKKRKKIFNQMIEYLHIIHSGFPHQQGEFYENNFEAMVRKTKRRLDSVAGIIPYLEKDKIIVNGKSCLNFYKHWSWVEKHLPAFFSDEYCFIHGDCTFSNILYDEEKQQLYLIDPRGYFGQVQYYGDIDYDWAKLYYSLIGNYDQFNARQFRLHMDDSAVHLAISSNGWEEMENVFFQKTKANPIKIQAFHAIIWLSLSSYVWDDYDSICGAFFNGIYYMQHVYEKISDPQEDCLINVHNS